MKTLLPLTEAGFILISVVYFGALMMFIRTALGRTSIEPKKQARIFFGIIIAVAAWLLFISVLASRQFFNDFSSLPPRFFIVLIVPLVVILSVSFRRTTREIILAIPPQYLVHLQTFRIFVEVLLWMLFVDNLLPVQMTFEGLNFDILAGLTAPIVGFFIARKPSKVLLIVWNILCMATLINIVTIAILSTPVPFRVFMNEPANTIVTQFPIIWLPGLLVPLAYTLHILSLRQALQLKD